MLVLLEPEDELEPEPEDPEPEGEPELVFDPELELDPEPFELEPEFEPEFVEPLPVLELPPEFCWVLLEEPESLAWPWVLVEDWSVALEPSLELVEPDAELPEPGSVLTDSFEALPEPAKAEFEAMLLAAASAAVSIPNLYDAARTPSETIATTDCVAFLTRQTPLREFVRREYPHEPTTSPRCESKQPVRK